MDEKNGSLIDKLRIFPFMFSSQIVLGIGLMIAGICVAVFSKIAIAIALLLVGALLFAAAVYQITQCGVMLYDKTIVVKSLFKTQEFPVSNIRAIYWDFPGARDVNPRGPRKNLTTAEIILMDGKTGARLSDAYYAKLEEKLTFYQNQRKISRTLDKK